MIVSWGEPVGENSATGEFDPLNFFDAWACSQCFERFLGRTRIEVQDSDRVSTGLLRSATDGHLTDIDTVLAKNGSHASDDPRDVVVGEQQHVAIEVGFQSVIIDRDESRHVVSKDGDPCFDTLAAAVYLGRDGRAEGAGFAAAMLD